MPLCAVRATAGELQPSEPLLACGRGSAAGYRGVSCEAAGAHTPLNQRPAVLNTIVLPSAQLQDRGRIHQKTAYRITLHVVAALVVEFCERTDHLRS